MRSKGIHLNQFGTVQTHTSGFSLNSGQVMGAQNQGDVDHVKRQLDEIQRELNRERDTTGRIIDQQDKEIEECQKELE